MSNAKRWALSTLVTFLTGFCMVFIAQIDDLSMNSFTDGTFVGVVFVAARSGIKAVIEAFLAYRARTAATNRDYLEQ